MASTALITGATSGIGRAFAEQLAAEHFDLVLVARDRERLERTAGELRSAHGVSVESLPADLSTPDGVAAVAERLGSPDAPVDMLVNNAGFGSSKRFVDMTAEEHDGMIRVNVNALVTLAHAAMSAMLPRGRGDIINVASVAAFLPGFRGSSTYAATKAFVIAFTEGLVPATKGTAVHTSALCPGFVKTEFHKRAGIREKKQSRLLWLEADDVVREALQDHRKGRILSIPTVRYKLIVAIARLAPRKMILRQMSRMGSR